ncbi:MAG: ROK family protein [Pseudomonadota bacterium]
MTGTGGGIYVAADIGGTTTRLAAFGPDHAVGDTLPELTKRPSDDLGPNPTHALQSWLQDAVPPGATLAGAVIGLPTMFDANTRRVQSSPNIPELVGQDVAEDLSGRLDIPVIVDRDTVILTTGEWVAGSAQGFRHVLGIFIGTGIGGAMLIDGVPYRGASGAGVEIGHMAVRMDGAPCVCGNTDCLEAYASGHVLAGAADRAGIAIEDVFTSPAVSDTIDIYVETIGYALASTCNLLDPEILLIGGGVGMRQTFPFDRIVAVLRQHLRRPSPYASLEIRRTALGSAAIVPSAQYLLLKSGKVS